MPIRISGLQSGLDTESIVTALVSAYSYKKDKYVKAQTKLSWKQDAWKSLNSKVYSLYTSVGSMRYSSNYSLKKSTVSDTTKATATASGSAINGTQTLEVNQLATTAYITGADLGENVTGDTTLASLGIKTGTATGNGVIQVRTGTSTTKIEIDSTMSISSLVGKLSEAGVQANFDDKNHRFFISSKTSGKAGDFSISANNTLGLTSLIKLGLMSDSEVSSIKSTATGSTLAKKTFSFTEDDNTYSFTNNTSDWATTLADMKTALSTAEEDRTDEQKKLVKLADYLSTKYADKTYEVTEDDGEGGETTNTYTYGTDGAIDWDTISDEALSALTEQIYADSSYDDAAASATSIEINMAVNAVRDAYVALAKAQSDTYDSDDAKTAAINEAKTNLATVLSDETNAKWASYIEENFGSQNSENDTSYSNFWVQSDNLELSQSVFYRVDLASNIAANNTDLTVSDDMTATKIDGKDSKIVLNGVEYSSSTNSVTVNGLTIEALGLTNGSPITVSVSSDTDALYDKVKDFLTSYNSLINEMQTLYNADSAKDYEPLTDDEKAEMSESEIEKWEQKIKDSLLRRDSSLSGLISTMTMAMMKTYTVNGKTYSWSTFGVHTLGTLNAEKNENYAYHIDGDSEDSYTSGNNDKLKAALAEDPDGVIDFLKQMTSGLYSEMDKKMKSTAVKSVYTVYNDKEMASEYSNYTKLIKTWTDRVTDMEDAYYKKFSAMESALATLQSNSSSISSLLGG